MQECRLADAHILDFQGQHAPEDSNKVILWFCCRTNTYILRWVRCKLLKTYLNFQRQPVM